MRGLGARGGLGGFSRFASSSHEEGSVTRAWEGGFGARVVTPSGICEAPGRRNDT